MARYSLETHYTTSTDPTCICFNTIEEVFEAGKQRHWSHAGVSHTVIRTLPQIAPVLPENLSDAAWHDMREAFDNTHGRGDVVRAMYRALFVHLRDHQNPSHREGVR